MATSQTLALIMQLQDEVSGELQKIKRGLVDIDATAKGTSASGVASLAALGGPAVVGGILAVGAAFVTAAGAGTQMNASLEQLTISFTSLLGGAEEATAMLNQLQAFAAKTPFEFMDLARGTQRLMGFGFEAETILPLMTSIGDAVSMIGGGTAEIDGVVRALGQMKASGRVLNEELLQLAELGLPVYDILGQAFNKTTAEIRKMAENGLLPAEQAITALANGFEQRFGGGMAKQAESFNGLMSTLKDNLGLALKAFTGPLFEQAKGGLQELGKLVASQEFQSFAANMGRAIGWALTIVVDFGRKVGQIFGGIADQAAGWGENIGSSLASGIVAAAAVVAQALSFIGSVISGLLKPGSPPKLLPDLDTWGTEAAQVYLDGWGKASNFEAFKELGDGIKSILENLVDAGGLGEQDLIPTLFGSQASIARIINEIETIGTVSEDAFTQLRQALGPAGAQGEQFIRTFVNLEKATRDVDAAQQELTAATEQYDAVLSGLRRELEAVRRGYDEQLKPINDQIAALDEQERTIRDQMRVAELNAMLSDDKVSAEEKALAAIELQRIEVEKQQRAIEAQQDAAVMAVQSQIDAVELQKDAEIERLEIHLRGAKAAQDAAKAAHEVELARISTTKEQNSLIQEQQQLLESLSKAASAGGGGGGGLAAALGDISGMPGLDSLTQSISVPLQEIEAAVDTTGQAMTDFKDNVLAPFKVAADTIAPSLDVWASAFISLIPIIDDAKAKYQEFFSILLSGDIAGAAMYSISVFQSFLPQWAETLNQWKTAGLDWIIAMLPEMGTLLGQVTGQLIAFGLDVIAKLIPLFAQLAVIATAWIINDVIPRLPGLLAAIWQTMVNFTTSLNAEVHAKFAEIAKAFVEWIITSAIPGMTAGMKSFVDIIIKGISDLQKEAASSLNALLDIVLDYAGGWAGAARAYVDNFLGGLRSAWSSVTGFVADALQGLRDMLPGSEPKDTSSPLYGLGEAGEAFANNLIFGIVVGIRDMTPQILSQLGSLREETLKALQDFAKEANEIAAAIFGDKASLDRQAASNIKSLTDLLSATDINKVQDELKKAQENSKKINADINTLFSERNTLLGREELLKRKMASGSATEQDIAEYEKIQDAINKNNSSLDALREKQKLANDELSRAGLAVSTYNQIREIQERVKQELGSLQTEMQRFSDPQLQSDWFQLRSKQIMEIAKLEKDMLLAKTDEERAAIQAQLDFVRSAQRSEMQQFEELAKNGGRRIGQTHELINGLVNQYNRLVQDGIRLQDQLVDKEGDERRELQRQANLAFDEAMRIKKLIDSLSGPGGPAAGLPGIGIPGLTPKPTTTINAIEKLKNEYKDLVDEANRYMEFRQGVLGTELADNLQKDAQRLFAEAQSIMALITALQASTGPIGVVPTQIGTAIKDAIPQTTQTITINVDARGASDPTAIEAAAKRAVNSALQSLSNNTALRQRYAI